MRENVCIQHIKERVDRQDIQSIHKDLQQQKNKNLTKNGKGYKQGHL